MYGINFANDMEDLGVTVHCRIRCCSHFVRARKNQYQNSNDNVANGYSLPKWKMLEFRVCVVTG